MTIRGELKQCWKLEQCLSTGHTCKTVQRIC